MKTINKNIEFFNLNPGSFFDLEWRIYGHCDLEWYYNINVSIEYVSHCIHQGFINRLLYGKIPLRLPVRHYDYEFGWKHTNTLDPLAYTFKSYSLEIYNEGKKERASKLVLDTFNAIVEECPSDNVIVFGYNLKIIDGKIEPEAIPCGPRHKDIYSMSIQCGFAGY